MPTDTLPGLHARADRPDAVARILDIKGRADDKPLLLLAATTEAALALAADPGEEARRYVARCWPGPFTLILPAGPAAPGDALRGRETVAVRVPAPEGLRSLIEVAGGPLVSTSANVAGEPPATDLETALAVCGEVVDLVADIDWSDAGRPPTGPSALLDLCVWPPAVVRAGATLPPEW